MRHDQLEGLLDRAVLALRATPVPEGFPPDLYASLLRAPQDRSIDHSPARLSRKRRPIPLFWKVPVAAAAIALVASLIVWFGNGRGSYGIAFADVLDKVGEVKTLTYRVTAKVPGQPDVVQNIMYLGARYKRNASLDGRFVQITDYTQGKMLTLIVHAEDPLSDVPQKQAIQIDKVPDTRTGARKKDQIELDWLQNLQRGAESVKDLGESKVDGKTAVGFAVKKQGQTNTLFADKETGFPLRLEITTDKRPSYVTILSDFVFNSQLDESLFSLDRPEGFVVQTMHWEDTPAAKWLKEHKSQADSEKQE